MYEAGTQRGVSPVIGVILLVAVTVVLAATIGGFLLSSGVQSEPAPFVAEASGTFVPQDGNDGGIVRLFHEGGDPIRVADIEIVVDAQSACGQTGRLVNLPAESGDPQPTSEYVRGDDVFDNSFNSVTGQFGDDERTIDGIWSPNEQGSFRIAKSACEITAGEQITIRVVHLPSESVIMTVRLTAG